MMDLRDKRILVTGGTGFLGQHLWCALRDMGATPCGSGCTEVCDLTDERETDLWFDHHKPEIVFHLAAKVGGIGFNARNGFVLLDDNLRMAVNVVEQCVNHRAKLIGVGSVCAYPEHCPTPFCEGQLWSGMPEPTNAPYGVAKRVLGELMRTAHISHGLVGAFPVLANLYGPGDHFDLADSHVIPALIRKAVAAKREGRGTFDAWGGGEATRDFLFVRDAVEALIRVAERVERPMPINIGTGRETSIGDAARLIGHLVGVEPRFSGEGLEGQRRRVLDTTRCETVLGWVPPTPLEQGLAETVRWYEDSLAEATV